MLKVNSRMEYNNEKSHATVCQLLKPLLNRKWKDEQGPTEL